MDELQKLPEAAAQEMMALSQKMEGVLRQVYTPDGINLGMNVGRAPGREWPVIFICTFFRDGWGIPAL